MNSKVLITVLFGLFLPFLMIAQEERAADKNEIPARLTEQDIKLDAVVNILKKKFQLEAEEYCLPIPGLPKSKKLSGEDLFTKRAKEVFSTVVTTNSDVVENGSAFAYVKDKDANTLSVNGALILSNKWILDIGAVSKSESNNYKFYAENTWSNDITGSIGISMKWRYAAKGNDSNIYLTPCESIKEKRHIFISDSIFSRYTKMMNWKYNPNIFEKKFPEDSEYHKFQDDIDKGDELIKLYIASCIYIDGLSKELYDGIKFSPYTDVAFKQPATTKITTTEKKTNNTDKSAKTTEQLNNKDTEVIIDYKIANDNITTTETITKTEPVKRDIKVEITELVEIRKTIVELLLLRDNEDSTDPINDYVQKKILSFDQKNDIITGYSIKWFTLKSFFTNSTIKVNNEEIIDEIVQKKINNLFKFSMELSANYAYDKNIFTYLKGYARFNRSSLLNSYILKDGGFNVAPVLNDDDSFSYYSIVDDKGSEIGKYSDLRRPVFNGDLGAYFATLPFAKKTFGFTAQVGFNFPIGNVNILYKPTYTLIAGLLLKAKKDAVIINIGGGLENQYHDRNAWDYFLLKASVGVPFTIFEKKKS